MNTQMQLDFSGRALRDLGMQRASSAAERKIPGWGDRAFGYLLEFVARTPKKFAAEDIREFAHERGLECPPSLRAWGGVLLAAAKRGIIRRVGFAPVRNPRAHCANAAIWERVL